LADFPALSKDERYATVSKDTRQLYEFKIAKCQLDNRQPEKARALTKDWNERYLQLQIEARAAAQLNEEQACRTAIGALCNEDPPSAWSLLLDTQEVAIYANQPWYLDLVVRLWQRNGSISLDELGAQLALHRRASLLQLRVAVADERHPVGALAVWTGVIRKSHIDRDANQTVLITEGVDVRNVLVEHDRKFTGYSSSAKPEYVETEHYEESFQPNGNMFVVTYPAASEKLVTLNAIVALGTYSGRTDGQNWPKLDALAVAERVPQEQTKGVQ
jgi:hypothetical protein